MLLSNFYDRTAGITAGSGNTRRRVVLVPRTEQCCTTDCARDLVQLNPLLSKLPSPYVHKMHSTVLYNQLRNWYR